MVGIFPGMSEKMTTVANGLSAVLFGADDRRLRATWRFLLAWPLLPLVGALVGTVMPALGLTGMIQGGPLQGLVFPGILLVWARYVDRRSLSAYGVSPSVSWLLNLLVGFAVVVGVWGGWHALASSLGWMGIEPAVTAPQGSALFGLGGMLVSLAINTWVQDVVFFAIVLASAAEGFRSRGVESRQAVVGGWLVGVLFFTAIHGTPTLVDAVSTAVGGAVFGLLYVHTGELALTIGVHWGSSYAAGTIFASPSAADATPSVFEVTTSLPGIVGSVNTVGLYLATYLLLVGWLVLSGGTLPSRRISPDGPTDDRRAPGRVERH